MIALLGLLAAVLVFLIGLTFGWRWVVAPLIGALIYAWGMATLRSLRHKTYGRSDEPLPTPGEGGPERVLYWCEVCGTEVLLVTRGSGTPPSHCGERMHPRVEV